MRLTRYAAILAMGTAACSDGATDRMSDWAESTAALTATLGFEAAPLGTQSATTYTESGYLFQALTSKPVVYGTADGYSSHVLVNANYGEAIRLSRADGRAFGITSFKLGPDRWSEHCDATITGYPVTGSTLSKTATCSTSKTSFALVTLGWSNLAKIEINFAGGTDAIYGAVDDFVVSDSGTASSDAGASDAGSSTIAPDAADSAADRGTVTADAAAEAARDAGGTTNGPPEAGGPTLGGMSVEFGRKLWGTDDAVRRDVPAGGTLFSVWTKIPDPGPVPWSRGNMDVYVLYGANWHMRCLTGNGSASSSSNATFNANSMLFIDPTGDWVDDYSYYLGTGLPVSQVVGWVWAAWQVVVDSNSFTIRQWLKYGLDGAVFAAGESHPTLADIRSTLVNQRGFPAAKASAWVPTDATSFQVGKDNGYLIHARMESTNVTPTLAHLDQIARASAADSTAWADYELTWVNGAPNLKDRSGHARDLSIDTGGTLYQGPAGPAFH